MSKIEDIAEQDFNAWKHHPVTKLFLRYTKDKREFIEKTAIQTWKTTGGIINETMRGQVIELEEIESIDFIVLQMFYGAIEEDNERESEAEAY